MSERRVVQVRNSVCQGLEAWAGRNVATAVSDQESYGQWGQGSHRGSTHLSLLLWVDGKPCGFWERSEMSRTVKGLFLKVWLVLRIRAGVRWQHFLVLSWFGSIVIGSALEYILHNRFTAVPGNAVSSMVFKNFLSGLRLAIWSYCGSFRGTHCRPFLLLPGTKLLSKRSRALITCQGQLSKMCA